MDTSAQGLRVVVTAGAAGIGRAIARTFLDHGARVHVCDVDRAALDAARGLMPEVTQTVADVARIDDVERLFADVRCELGGLELLVNNAGILRPTASTEDIDKTVRDGLGLRWSFTGPLETVDLDARGGVLDYARRYGATMVEMDRAQHPRARDAAALVRLEAERRAALPADRFAAHKRDAER
jgi:NAD(P)-dependent dehydrogenase (short-subunit alcohol dehydrogenase family)